MGKIIVSGACDLNHNDGIYLFMMRLDHFIFLKIKHDNNYLSFITLKIFKARYVIYENAKQLPF
jgi:hypothetical protein